MLLRRRRCHCRYGALRTPSNGIALTEAQLRNRARNDELLAEQVASGVVSRQKVVETDPAEEAKRAEAREAAKTAAKAAKAAKAAAVRVPVSGFVVSNVNLACVWWAACPSVRSTTLDTVLAADGTA